MAKDIALFIDPIKDPKILTDKETLNAILQEIEDIGNMVFDLDTIEGVEETKELKRTAKNWVDSLKLKCDPLEAAGKEIADARSTLTKALLTGKDSVINKILNPIILAEKKLDYLSIKVATPIKDMRDCEERFVEAKELIGFNWLAYKSQADKLLEKYTAGAAARKVELEIIAKAAQDKLDAEREAREKELAKNAAGEAVREIEAKYKREAAYKKDQEVAKKEQEDRDSRHTELEKERKANDEEHQKKINNEILEALTPYIEEAYKLSSEGEAKAIIKAIANNRIPHLYIKY